MPIISSFGAGTGRGFGLTSGGPSKFIEACGGTVSTDGNYRLFNLPQPAAASSIGNTNPYNGNG